jgi:pimeloyl-ACP methyl ester carboxylesterase
LSLFADVGHQLECSLTLIYGDKDRVTPHYRAFGFSKYLTPYSTITKHLLTGRKHLFVLDHLEETLNLIRRALQVD